MNRLNNKGFISTSVIYTLFVTFLSMLLVLLNIYIHNRTLLTAEKENLKENLSTNANYLIEDGLLYHEVLNNNKLKELDNKLYFAGDENNNYLKFNDMLWQIISVDENNNIQLVYIESNLYSAFNLNSNNSNYVGYKYDIELENGFTEDSELKKTIDNFYELNLMNKEEYIIDNEICINRRYEKLDETINYEFKNNLTSSCNSNDILSVKNGKLKYPISTLTAYDVRNTIENERTFLSFKEEYWTLTPYDYINFATVTSFNNVFSSKEVNSVLKVYPVIIISGAVYTKGTGSNINPYEIVGEK